MEPLNVAAALTLKARSILAFDTRGTLRSIRPAGKRCREPPGRSTDPGTAAYRFVGFSPACLPLQSAGEQPVNKTVPRLFTAGAGGKVVRNRGFPFSPARTRFPSFLDRTVGRAKG
jgi:hypothetical protein